MLFTRAEQHENRTAIVADAHSWTFRQLLAASQSVAAAVLDGGDDMNEARVAFLLPPGFEYVATQWGIWRAGGIAVPLGLKHPAAELQYVLDDTAASVVVVRSEDRDRLAPLWQSRPIRVLTPDQALSHPAAVLPRLDPSRRAMILYTSGTTSRPKGVVTTHANIQAQVESLVQAWAWSSDDHILHVLPLHHIHGIINVLTCALWSGATCEFLAPWDADAVLDRFAQGDLTLFMAVPTIYAKLIAAWKQSDADRREAIRAGCQRMRLMVSGSAALPVTTLHEWRQITGQTLLERYGMTEIGMALSNPLHGERVAGHVGHPLPGIEVRRTDESGNVVEDGASAGEIEVRGKGVFLEYWQQPDLTAKSYRHGWFRTGDVAVVDDQGGFRLLGRTSVDIIKTGGYKVSALEIEEVLRTHPDIRECAIVGVPDDEWGERVAACLLVRDGSGLSLDALRIWAKQRLAAYKVPTRMKTVTELPRNPMGKVQKPAIQELFRRPPQGSS